MNQLKYINLNIIITYIIATFFLILRELQSISRLLFIIILFYVNSILFLKNYKNIKLKLNQYFILNIIILIYLLAYITTPYKFIFTINITIFLIIAYLCYKNDDLYENINPKIYKIIYILCLLSIIIQIFLGKINLINGNIALYILGDKNYSGVLIILFYMYCDKRKFILGRIISVIILLILESRASVMVLIFFIIFKMFKSQIYNVLLSLKLNKMYKIFFIMLVFISLFSYFWSYKVAMYDVNEYQQGLNDGSNKMRFAANVYALEELKNNRELLLYGYDDSFNQVVGIDSEDKNLHTRYMGARLVQPHNSIINIIIKSGILISTIYFFILSKIIDKKLNLDNIEYILAYLISSLFLHRLLDGKFLILWILIIYMPSLKYKIKYIRS